jgi:hypothetical protein
MAHFTRFQFSLGLKSLILAIYNFRWASNRPFQPFSFFIGPQINHFSRFRFSLELSPYRVSVFSIAKFVKIILFATIPTTFLLKSHTI